MLYVLLIPIVMVALYFAYIILKKIIKEVIKEIKEYKESSESDKAFKELVFIVLVFPVIVYFMDKYNLFSFLKLNENISIDYDWLSFIGTYAGTIISALFLIYITRMDRKDNNENVRESQRPNLCTIFYFKSNKSEIMDRDTFFNCEMGNPLPGFEYPIVNIYNSGQTVAIINVDKSYITVQKIENDKSLNEEKTKNTIFKMYFNELQDRIHVAANNDVTLVAQSKVGHMVKDVYIEYKDLFGKEYIDYSKGENGKIEVIKDNELKK